MKKRNWKVMSLLLAGTMLAGTLTGCGSSPSNEGSSSAEESSQQSEEQSEQQSEGQSEEQSEEQSEQQPAASGDVVDIK